MTFGAYDHSPNGKEQIAKNAKNCLLHQLKNPNKDYSWFSSIHGQHLGVNNRLV
jgi:hypothetical protein